MLGAKRMNQRQSILVLVCLLVFAVGVASSLLTTLGPELPPGVLGQRCRWVIEQGYPLTNTTYTFFQTHREDPAYTYLEYREPGDWTAFSTELQNAMDTQPEYITVHYVYDDAHSILYYRLDLHQQGIHELVAYWIL
jgi:hypothetical protein